mmetsp:Transcript_19270/g.18406  ORF Transcript_19270/g.18406 Transcript_19270/m.18406 type:complete len:201 (+) Transcript_19270:2011-2613(+)|eukprot:CAMPEP_0170566518 /NCGR_PEP_ID=MMETSP0211-20121228/79891_1 /TAXON_ID=311385 /ORGANISM="Pseudokeronopsis sp., Strain OXSARD2" /LENGTH=200 /DNA_ID=CAMNT_0010887723 /DNA_START=1934 /DNA_END=2536 /DNA_ORIENTATION=+
MKSKLHKDYPEGRKQVVAVKKNSGNPSNQNSSYLNKMIVEDLDWKKSKIYTDYCLQRHSTKQVFEKDVKLFKEDELDYIQRTIKDYQPGKKSESEVNIFLSPLVTKAHNTLRVLYREILQEEYYPHEYDRIVIEMTFNGDKFLQLSFLIQKMRLLFRAREEMTDYLIKIAEREACLTEMKQTVMNIQNEEEIENENKELL